MSLTKKHFNAIADILSRHATSYDMATEFADFCERQNPNFDRMAFLTAIGVQITEPPKPRCVYVNVGSHDWEPLASVHATVEESMAQFHEDMQLHEESDAPIPGTLEWFMALSAAYENDKWKGYEIYAVDVDGVKIRAVHDVRDTVDWTEVGERVRTLYR